jgi:hypothetical protein
MPEKKTIQRARKDLRAGKSASTAAGEFVREEIHHVREGKHGARSTEQAIAIGLSKARRAGVPLGKEPASSGRRRTASRKSSSRTVASKQSLSRKAKESARKRSPAQRSASAKKAARTRARNQRKRS